MTSPHFTRTLHFRISALFVLMLGIVAGGFYFWLNATAFSVDMVAEEENWYENLAQGELDSLAHELSQVRDDELQLNKLLTDYGLIVSAYETELIIFDSQGRNLTSTHPDSLGFTIPTARTELLSDMSSGTWDYSSYPIPEDIEAYENRIYEVDRLYALDAADSTVTGYLVASYEPITIGIEELEGEERRIGFQAILLILVYAALSGLVIMAWMSRRITSLSRGMTEFTAGDLSLRVPAKSMDEIGALGRSFNSMASHIQEMVAKLQEKELFQRQLIANISHDLRTPMASMRGYAETLSIKADELSDQDRDRYVAIITANLEHLDNLIDHMLTLSRFESGQAVFQMEDFPLAELIDSIIMRTEPLAVERGISLEFECDKSFAALVNADPMQIAQVLQNLIENGIKFNRQGGRVIIAVESDSDKRIKVLVRDTGQGIATEDLPHIFKRFYTADKSRTRAASPGVASVQQHLGQSSGLGLAIAAKIISGHNSKLMVESELGAGTTFQFSLDQAEEAKTMAAEG